MAIIDAFTVFSGSTSAAGVISGQTVTGTNTSVLSTNTYDLGVARDIGKGMPLNVIFETIVAASGGTSVQFQVITADDAALSSNVEVINQTDAIPVATLTAGTQIPLVIDRIDPLPAKRYIGLRYVLVGAVAAGSYFAGIVVNVPDKQTNYASGFVVL